MLVQQPRRGAYAARNLGSPRAGELIAFIDSDDRWYPDRLARQLPLLDASDVGLVFGNAMLSDHRVPTRSQAAHRVPDHAATPWMGHAALRVRQLRADVLGPGPAVLSPGARRLSETPPLSADYLTWFRISLRYRFDYVPEPVFEYSVHAGGISSDLVKSLHARIELFASLLADTMKSPTADELRRVLFHLRLSLAVAWLRRDPLGAPRVLAGSRVGCAARRGVRVFGGH